MPLTALDLDDHTELDAFEAEKAASARELEEIYLFYLFIYFKICIYEVYTGVRTKRHNIPYKVQPPYPTPTL